MKEKFGGKLDDLDWSLSEEDLSNTLLHHESSPLLFGVVEGDTVLTELGQIGALSKIEEKGYNAFRVDKSTHVQYGDRFLLWATHESDGKEYLLFDIRTRFAEIDWHERRIKALFWEWLGFQDPKGSFSPERPPLPGQEFPGLGVFRACTQVMRNHIGETHADAIVAIPEYFHNAWLYSGDFKFYEPEVEGRFRALIRDLRELGLSGLSHAVNDGRVLDKSGLVYEWKPHHQALPLNRQTKSHFLTDEYLKTVEAFKKSSRFRLQET